MEIATYGAAGPRYRDVRVDRRSCPPLPVDPPKRLEKCHDGSRGLEENPPSRATSDSGETPSPPPRRRHVEAGRPAAVRTYSTIALGGGTCLGTSNAVVRFSGTAFRLRLILLRRRRPPCRVTDSWNLYLQHLAGVGCGGGDGTADVAVFARRPPPPRQQQK